jgi:hypothetical protein
MNKGIKQQLQSAKTTSQISLILTAGQKFENPHPGTVRKWEREATKARTRIASKTP